MFGGGLEAQLAGLIERNQLIQRGYNLGVEVIHEDFPF